MNNIYAEINRLETNLKDRILIVQNLKAVGDKACSKYDLSMGYNAEYYLRDNSILYAQITSLTNQITNLKSQIPLSLF